MTDEALTSVTGAHVTLVLVNKMKYSDLKTAVGGLVVSCLSGWMVGCFVIQLAGWLVRLLISWLGDVMVSQVLSLLLDFLPTFLAICLLLLGSFQPR